MRRHPLAFSIIAALILGAFIIWGLVNGWEFDL